MRVRHARQTGDGDKGQIPCAVSLPSMHYYLGLI